MTKVLHTCAGCRSLCLHGRSELLILCSSKQLSHITHATCLLAGTSLCKRCAQKLVQIPVPHSLTLHSWPGQHKSTEHMCHPCRQGSAAGAPTAPRGAFASLQFAAPGLVLTASCPARSKLVFYSKDVLCCVELIPCRLLSRQPASLQSHGSGVVPLASFS